MLSYLTKQKLMVERAESIDLLVDMSHAWRVRQWPELSGSRVGGGEQDNDTRTRARVHLRAGNMMGSGVYIVTGAIMHNKAGPAAFLSYLLSGLAAFFSCLCYAELASRIPRAGSAYTYTYVRQPLSSRLSCHQLQLHLCTRWRPTRR